MESAMGPTVPMLFPGPLRRIKLTDFPGVVTVHYIISSASSERYQDVERATGYENIADCGTGDWIDHYRQNGPGGMGRVH